MNKEIDKYRASFEKIKNKPYNEWNIKDEMLLKREFEKVLCLALCLNNHNMDFITFFAKYDNAHSGDTSKPISEMFQFCRKAVYEYGSFLEDCRDTLRDYMAFIEKKEMKKGKIFERQ